MKFRCKLFDINSIQRLHRIIHTISKLTDQTCVIRITPNRFYVFTKRNLINGGWYICAEIRPDRLFDEFQMSGYADDANEIYVEIRADVLMQSLKTPALNAKFVKMKLTNKSGPCMNIEAELPSSTNSSRKTLFDVPVTIVHRLMWPDLTPSEETVFNASCYLPLFKIFKGVVERLKSLGNSVEFAVNRDGELKLHAGEPAVGYSINSHFQALEVPEDARESGDVSDFDEEETEIHSSNGFYKVTVDIRQLSLFLGALQFLVTRMRCDIRHRRYVQLLVGSDDFRVRYWTPSIDSQ